jgi:nitroimidazol reductase NimA-like FMN-containing flavoprotein (pyridoxamine 5'-phosphate oxidase superfamily)
MGTDRPAIAAMAVESLAVLSRDECQRRLHHGRLGRVAVVVDAVPAIFPVNYALLDEEIVFRTAPGTKLCAGILERVVAFEVDGTTLDFTSGWSVLVVGRAAQIHYPAMLERAQRLGLRPWVRGPRDYFVKITSEHISGRSYGPGQLDGDGC